MSVSRPVLITCSRVPGTERAVQNFTRATPPSGYTIEIFPRTITNPRYNEHIFPVPWDFVISGFHCIFFLPLRGEN